jgi:BNR repeat-like domain
MALLSRFALLSAIPVLLSDSASSQSLPKAPKTEVITVTPKPGFFTEPSIGVNPANPLQVVAAFQDNAHIAYSVDGGRHWQLATGIEPPNYRVSGDVSVTFDNQGHAYICYIAFDKLGTFNYWGHNSSRNGIYVRRSLDGGVTWEARDIAATEQPDQATVPWEDKPYIVADMGRGPHAGNLYIGWTRWTLSDSQILFVRSTDHGKTWSKPVEIDNVRGLPRDDNGAIEGFAGAVGPDSTLYAVWTDGNHVVFTTSRDGGATFSHTRNIIDTAPTMFTLQAVSRANGFAQIAIDPRGGAKGGRLYLTWSDYRNGDVDVFCSTSTNHGETWSPAVRVNDDSPHNGADQFFQWMAVDPADGAAYVVFYDRRGDPKNRQQIVALARSTDGGRTFQNYAWMDQPFDAQGVFMGDYNGIAALNGRVYGVWTQKPENKSSRDTLIQIGVADFNTEKIATVAPQLAQAAKTGRR